MRMGKVLDTGDLHVHLTCQTISALVNKVSHDIIVLERTSVGDWLYRFSELTYSLVNPCYECA